MTDWKANYTKLSHDLAGMGAQTEEHDRAERAEGLLLRLWRMTDPGDECPQETVHSILHDYLVNEGKEAA